MTYAVMSHGICHLLDIRYDAYDITSWATAIGRKPVTIVSQPIIAIPEAVKGRNQGQVGLDYARFIRTGCMRRIR